MYLKPLHLPKACILVLAEDLKLRTTLCRLLIDAGYTIADAQSGANTVGHVDLVLASIGAPGTPSGLLERAIPAIALVDHRAWTGFDFFDAANDLGAVAVLQRPFSRTALLHLMATVLSDAERETVTTEDDAAEEAGPADFLPHLGHSHFA